VESAPYGSWPSPIASSDVARGASRVGGVQIGPDGTLLWAEGRPSEGGRTAIVRREDDGRHTDLLPPPWNVRSRVHEYGGGAWTALAGEGLVFVNWADQRLYLLDPRVAGHDPVPLTPEPSQPQSDRYADLVSSRDGSEVICVRERDLDGVGLARDLVAVPLDGSLKIRVLVTDGHFLSNPRQSPDGRHLSWLTWDHPRMPWDGTELRVASVSDGGEVGEARTLIGGHEESVFQPEWAGPDALYAVSDRSGWWNLYEVSLSGEVLALCEKEEEFGHPQWVFGMARYAVLDDGRIATTHGTGTWSFSLLDPATGDLDTLAGPSVAQDRVRVEATGGPSLAAGLSHFEPLLSAHRDTVALVGGGALIPLSVIVVDLRSAGLEVVRSTVSGLPPAGFLPEIRQLTIESPRGRDVHAFVYPPKSADHEGPSDERPPFVAFVHGGPTAQTTPVLDVEAAYFTSRGIGVVKVDYGGSSGYGREYRNRLRGEWGVVDVEDVTAVMERLAQDGDADVRRLAIRGSSAGGWTVLCAVTTTRVFAAGTSYYGVGDLVALAEDTHDFESRYIDGLVGPLPEARPVYDERSPLSHVDSISCPVLLLQGSEDKVVPPSQAETFVEAMRRKGMVHAFVLFEGEQHGFRRAENIQRALEGELSFYGQVLGFDTPGVAVLDLSRR
jgi:dipeptidyl aminopeptidase/acylaminoacyl peptidase